MEIRTLFYDEYFKVFIEDTMSNMLNKIFKINELSETCKNRIRLDKVADILGIPYKSSGGCDYFNLSSNEHLINPYPIPIQINKCGYSKYVDNILQIYCYRLKYANALMIHHENIPRNSGRYPWKNTDDENKQEKVLNKKCVVCGKEIGEGMTDGVDFYCCEGCFEEYMDRTYGRHCWMNVGDDGEDGWYVVSEDDECPEGCIRGTGIYYTTWYDLDY